jgi:hypothetical protein
MPPKVKCRDYCMVCRPSSSLTGRGGGKGVVEEPINTTTRKPGHSVLSGEIVHFSGGGDEMVQICSSFRYILLPKKNFMRIISIKKIIIVGVVGILLRKYCMC